MNKKNCCGCRACEQICPKKCIKMIEDEEGYLYPSISKEQCINCGLCKKVCPFIKDDEIKQQESDEFYKLIAKDNKILKESSSGGAFSAIVEAILKLNQDEKFKIYGCTLDDKMQAKHVGVDRLEDISIFRKSKYLQSNLMDCYKKIKEDLSNRKIVIFTGTPCQVAGLKKFIGNINKERLYTIDLICHGVPSQKVFNMYIDGVEKKYNKKIKSINFREKIKIGNKIDSLGVRFKFDDGTTKKEYTFQNIYMLGFYKGLYFRPCCENCPFASKERVSDITIGDFWGIEKQYKKINPHKGVSLCIVNSEKGKKILKVLKEDNNLSKEDKLLALENNHNLVSPSKISRCRQDFFEKLQETNDFESAVNQYIKKKSKIVFLISSNMNEKIKNKIKKVLKNNES